MASCLHCYLWQSHTNYSLALATNGISWAPANPFIFISWCSWVNLQSISAPIVYEDTNSVDKDRDSENWLQGMINWSRSAKVCHQNSSPWPNWLKLDPQSHLPSQARLCHLRRASRRPHNACLGIVVSKLGPVPGWDLYAKPCLRC